MPASSFSLSKYSRFMVFFSQLNSLISKLPILFNYFAKFPLSILKLLLPFIKAFLIFYINFLIFVYFKINLICYLCIILKKFVKIVHIFFIAINSLLDILIN